MNTLAFPAPLESSTGSVRMRELSDRLLKSCTRKPIDVQRWHEWKRGRRDLSIEMLQNAVNAGGKKVYARAILLQVLADFADDGSETPPSLHECERLAIEADLASDRARQMALLDGTITPDEVRELEVTYSEEISVSEMLLSRLRRLVRLAPPQQVGVRSW